MYRGGSISLESSWVPSAPWPASHLFVTLPVPLPWAYNVGQEHCTTGGQDYGVHDHLR
jgi:hypothetical protein